MWTRGNEPTAARVDSRSETLERPRAEQGEISLEAEHHFVDGLERIDSEYRVTRGTGDLLPVGHHEALVLLDDLNAGLTQVGSRDPRKLRPGVDEQVTNVDRLLTGPDAADLTPRPEDAHVSISLPVGLTAAVQH